MNKIYFIYFFLYCFLIFKCKEDENQGLKRACESIKSTEASPDNCMVASLQKDYKCCYTIENDERKCIYIEKKNITKTKNIDCFSNYIKYNFIILFVLILIV